MKAQFRSYRLEAAKIRQKEGCRHSGEKREVIPRAPYKKGQEDNRFLSHHKRDFVKSGLTEDSDSRLLLFWCHLLHRSDPGKPALLKQDL